MAKSATYANLQPHVLYLIDTEKTHASLQHHLLRPVQPNFNVKSGIQVKHGLNKPE